MIKASLDVSKVTKAYGAALRQLASLTGFSQKAVLLGEAGIILKTCAGRTKVATEKQADRRSWKAILGKAGLDVSGASGTKVGDITVNTGARGPFGRVWVRTKRKKFKLAGVISEGGQTFRPMNYHWKNAMWSDIQELADDVAIQSRKKIPKGRAAIGLARQSWIQIADALNIDLSAVEGGGSLSAAGIAKARAAIAVSGRPHQNGTGSALDDKEKTVVTLINRLPYGQAIGFDRTLLGVVAGRAKYFEKSYAHGAFDSMRAAARSYPWLKVRAAA